MFNQTISPGGRQRAATPALLFALGAAIWPLASPFAEAQAQVPGRIRAEIELEGRGFPEAPVDPRQPGLAPALALRAHYDLDWDGGDQLFELEPFFRYDPNDSRRTHFDFSVLSWTLMGDVWELRIGLRTVFWGVNESQHLVDIINQPDLVEDPDGEDKLGQPMANLALFQDWGTLEIFIMPFFRERTFPGIDGRLRTQPGVDGSLAEYESGAGRYHIDWALRWFHTLGAWDIGLSHFVGTSREPRLVPRERAGDVALAPFYPQIDQTGLDLQMTGEAWLWKLETVTRGGFGDRYVALTAGFERTLVGVLGSNGDLGLLAEYLYDSRGRGASSTTPFQNDVFFGARFVLNDVKGTEVLAGAIVDVETQATLLSIEGSRRFGDAWSAELRGRAFVSSRGGDPLSAFRRDHYIELSLTRHF